MENIKSKIVATITTIISILLIGYGCFETGPEDTNIFKLWFLGTGLSAACSLILWARILWDDSLDW